MEIETKLGIETKLEKYEIEMGYIKQAIDELKQMSEKVSQELPLIRETISRQELLLEKITNIKSEYTTAINRVHSRIDNLEENMNKIGEIELQTTKLEQEINFIKEKINKNDKVVGFVTTTVFTIIIASILYNIGIRQ